MRNAEAEARRIAAIRAAAARPGFASWSTGPRTAEGKRKTAANATKHGGNSTVVKLATAYAEALLQCLSETQGSPRPPDLTASSHQI